MSIKYKKGNLLDAFDKGEVNVIAHQCNCFHTFGSGIAKEIRERFPAAYRADLETIKGDKEKLGLMHSVFIPDNKVICNIYSQYEYGRDKRYTNYGALAEGLVRVANIWVPSPNRRFGFPKIGCGSAGGDWTIVSEMIEHIFRGQDVTVYEF